jgi:hypothetical protein
MASDAPLTVAQVVERLGLEVCAAEEGLAAEVTGAVVSDLLSYVMAHGRRGFVWVTIQTHANIVAVAALGGLAAIVLADGSEPGEDTAVRAEEEGILLLRAADASYAVAGKLWELGVR